MRTMRINHGFQRKPQMIKIQESELKVMLFTNARDESRIKEWAAHHLLLGFDIVYIFDHKSKKPIKNEFVNFKKRVLVERCEMENPVKLPLMQRAANIAKSVGAHWFIYLDADEFLILNTYPNVKRMLFDFPLAHSLGINWLFFGTSHYVKEPTGLILENYVKSDLLLDKHVKTFVKPQFIVNSLNPHYYKMRRGCRLMSINHTVMNPTSNLAFNPWNIEYYKSPAYIAHYIFQSQETYINRKIKLPADDTGGMRNEQKDVHEYYNGHENKDPCNKYASRIKEFLQKIDMPSS